MFFTQPTVISQEAASMLPSLLSSLISSTTQPGQRALLEAAQVTAAITDPLAASARLDSDISLSSYKETSPETEINPHPAVTMHRNPPSPTVGTGRGFAGSLAGCFRAKARTRRISNSRDSLETSNSRSLRRRSSGDSHSPPRKTEEINCSVVDDGNAAVRSDNDACRDSISEGSCHTLTSVRPSQMQVSSARAEAAQCSKGSTTDEQEGVKASKGSKGALSGKSTSRPAPDEINSATVSSPVYKIAAFFRQSGTGKSFTDSVEPVGQAETALQASVKDETHRSVVRKKRTSRNPVASMSAPQASGGVEQWQFTTDSDSQTSGILALFVPFCYYF